MRDSLKQLASDPDSITVRRIWKALTPDERALGISSSLADDPEGWVKNTTRAAVATALRFRPQSVSGWPRQKLVSEAARLPIDDAQLLGSYLIDLHLGHRRPMMGEFLDELGIKNDEGRIDSENTTVEVQDESRVASAAEKIAAHFSDDDVAVYFLTLLLQDATIWAAVKTWLRANA